ncbi:MAG: metal-dependent transcriptional regulator [Candidatus Omnitrophota bacterium]
MHTLNDKEEEILESMWIQIKENKKTPDTVLLRDDPELKSLIEKGFIDLGARDYLTPRGLDEARLCVRRHRLSERLLADLFAIKDPLMHEASCKFEHGLHQGLEDNICTLLGHPRACPHGKPIPEGACCRLETKTPTVFVNSLNELAVGDRGKISYLNTQDSEVLKKLIAMGILPGNEIMLLHKFPSFVFEMNRSHFAVDADLARHIHILLLKRK